MVCLCTLLSVCSIAIGAFGMRLALRDLNEGKSQTRTFNVRIESYEYNDYNKHSGYIFHAYDEGESIVLEITNLHKYAFLQEKFEKEYLPSNVYTVVAMQKDYNEHAWIPIVGMKYGDTVLLDENNVSKATNFNSRLGIGVSLSLVLFGIIAFLWLCFALRKTPRHY